jgi:hypothetical protein
VGVDVAAQHLFAEGVSDLRVGEVRTATVSLASDRRAVPSFKSARTAADASKTITDQSSSLEIGDDICRRHVDVWQLTEQRGIVGTPRNMTQFSEGVR